MAWNKKYLLQRIVKIQEITLQHKQRGATQKWIFENHIYPVFIISEPTYKLYLRRNAKKELRELIEQENINTQAKIEFKVWEINKTADLEIQNTK